MHIQTDVRNLLHGQLLKLRRERATHVPPYERTGLLSNPYIETWFIVRSEFEVLDFEPRTLNELRTKNPELLVADASKSHVGHSRVRTSAGPGARTIPRAVGIVAQEGSAALGS